MLVNSSPLLIKKRSLFAHRRTLFPVAVDPPPIRRIWVGLGVFGLGQVSEKTLQPPVKRHHHTEVEAPLHLKRLLLPTSESGEGCRSPLCAKQLLRRLRPAHASLGLVVWSSVWSLGGPWEAVGCPVARCPRQQGPWPQHLRPVVAWISGVVARRAPVLSAEEAAVARGSALRGWAAWRIRPSKTNESERVCIFMRV